MQNPFARCARARARRIAQVMTFLGIVSVAAASAAQQIVDVHTAAPGVITVVVETRPLAQTDPASLPLDASRWLVDGAPPKGLFRYSVPWDENKALEVTVRHRVYLELGSTLLPGHTYAIQTPFGDRNFAFDEGQVFCEAIKVNQVGYNRAATSRFANFGVYLGDGGSRAYDPAPAYKVVRESDGQVVTTGTGLYMGDDSLVDPNKVTSGEHVYRLSLNEVPEGGPYSVVVKGCGRSRSFGVGERYTGEIARVAVRGLYHHRCGMALEQPHTEYTRATCHEEVADTRATWSPGKITIIPEGTAHFSIAGGYHDAGDFDRRPFHLIIPILLLGYFEAFPEHFVDGQYEIPESGNGIPDFLDEAMWSLRVWDRLQVMDPGDPDYGAVRQGTETFRHPAYGEFSAASDNLPYGSWSVSVETTALSAGIFAQVSRLIAPYDVQRSEQLLQKARLAWSWLEAHANVQATETKFMYAALQLYLATGETSLRRIFEAAARVIVLGPGSWPDPSSWPEQYIPGNNAAKCETVHFVSYLLADRPTDAALAEALKARIFSVADRGTYMGPAPEGEPYPQGVTKFMAWGAATAQGRYADVFSFAHRFTTDPAKRQLYFNAVAQYGDFALGLNPMGMSFVTGLGTDQPVSPLQLDSYFTKYGLSDGITRDHEGHPNGNVPGILIYGPTSGRSGQTYQRAVSDKLYPAWDALPLLRRWGDGWSLVNSNEFSVWETIVWNAALHGFLYDASHAAPPQPPFPPVLLD